MDTDSKLSENRVVATRIGVTSEYPGARQFVLDYEGPKLDSIPEDKPPAAISSCSSNAAIFDCRTVRNPYMNTWRVYLKMRPTAENHDPVDLRCTLQQGTNVVSETWTYQWSPP